jgi:hypothetical protein
MRDRNIGFRPIIEAAPKGGLFLAEGPHAGHGTGAHPTPLGLFSVFMFVPVHNVRKCGLLSERWPEPVPERGDEQEHGYEHV